MAVATSARSPGWTLRGRHAWRWRIRGSEAGSLQQGRIEVIDVGGEIDIYTAPRLRELLIDLASKNNYQLIVNMDKVGFLDSTGLGVLVGGLKRVRAHEPGIGKSALVRAATTSSTYIAVFFPQQVEDG